MTATQHDGSIGLRNDGLRAILDTALDAVVVIRDDGMITAWSSAAERVFGWNSDEAIGRRMTDLIVPEQHRQAHDNGMARYLATGVERVLGRRIEITASTRSGSEIPVELSIARLEQGGTGYFIGFLRDISARRLAEAAAKRRADEAELLFQVTRLAAETDSFDGALRACLKAICDLTGWAVGHAFVVSGEAEPELVSTSVWYETVLGSSRILQEETARVRFTKGVGLPGQVLATGEPNWMSNTEADPAFLRKGHGFGAAFGFPIKSEGKIIAVLEFFSPTSLATDTELLLAVRTLGEQVGRVFERKRKEEHERLLVNELNHRVKNTLAIVQSMAAQTFKGDAAKASARQAFESRLTALAAAHDVLTGANWVSASLREVIEKTGVGCGAETHRIKVRGPDVELKPRMAVAMALALHELCTNAIKYGALSVDEGEVTLSWEIVFLEHGSRLGLCWRERGGPTVSQPLTRGFGSRMIERALAAELGGTAELHFEADGLICKVDAPLT
jgi:PAS domain S-box-containing protein